MPSGADLVTLKEHADVLKFLMLMFGAGLLSASLWIFRTMNKNIDKLFELVGKHETEIAKQKACIGRMCTAHAINHDQEIDCE